MSQKSHCPAGYAGFDCSVWTRSEVNEPFFLAYRWATFVVFGIIGLWTLQAIRIRKSEGGCRCSSTPTICLSLIIIAAVFRCTEFAIDPHMWAGVLPWNLRALCDIPLALMMAGYCTELVAWILLIQKFAVGSAGAICCLSQQPKLLAGSASLLIVGSIVSIALNSAGVISDHVGTISYDLSLILGLLLCFGYTLVFGRRVMQLVEGKVSRGSLVLKRLTRFIFVACMQNLCAIGILTVSYFFTCQGEVMPIAECLVAWYGGFRVLEVVACVLIVGAVRRTYSNEIELFSDGWTTKQASSGTVEYSSQVSSFPYVPGSPPLAHSPVPPSFFSWDELLLQEKDPLPESAEAGGRSVGRAVTADMLLARSEGGMIGGRSVGRGVLVGREGGGGGGGDLLGRSEGGGGVGGMMTGGGRSVGELLARSEGVGLGRSVGKELGRGGRSSGKSEGSSLPRSVSTSLFGRGGNPSSLNDPF